MASLLFRFVREELDALQVTVVKVVCFRGVSSRLVLEFCQKLLCAPPPKSDTPVYRFLVLLAGESEVVGCDASYIPLYVPLAKKQVYHNHTSPTNT